MISCGRQLVTAGVQEIRLIGPDRPNNFYTMSGPMVLGGTFTDQVDFTL